MIPAAFDYVAPTSVDEALAALGSDVEEAKVLAGGQSLIPVLRLRLAAPTLVVDVGRIPDLQGIRDDGGALVVGPMTTHHALTQDPRVAVHAPLLAQVAQSVADPQVRHRGTIGGALVHADPAGDFPAAALALEAELTVTGPSGSRIVPAAEFFTDLFTTAVGEDELLTGIRVPKRTGWGTHYEKFHRAAQQWSIVGVAAMVRLDGDAIAEARIALTNMASTAIRATTVEQALAGGATHPDAVARAAHLAVQGTRPQSDVNADPDYRRHLAQVLTRRAVLAACDRFAH